MFQGFKTDDQPQFVTGKGKIQIAYSVPPRMQALTYQFTVPIRKTRFFPAHFMKLPVAPMISKIHKQYIPHSKALKKSFRFQISNL